MDNKEGKERLDCPNLLRRQRLEVILESDGKRVIEIIASTGIQMEDNQFLPLILSSIKATPDAGELLGNETDLCYLYRYRFNSLYLILIKIGENLFPNNYSIRTEIKSRND